MTIQECYAVTGSDYNGCVKRLMRDTLVKKFALKFLDEGSFALLRTSLEGEDWETAFRAAHTLKGVCQNLSFTALAESSSGCTEALRAGNHDQARQLFAQVERDYTALIQALGQVE